MILSSSSGALVLESDENDWCQVLLEVGGHRMPLGADTEKVVVERLLRALADTPVEASAGTLDGVSVRWVLSLFERHSSLYVGDRAGQRLLFIQSSTASLLANLALDADEVARWREQLTSVGT